MSIALVVAELLRMGRQPVIMTQRMVKVEDKCTCCLFYQDQRCTEIQYCIGLNDRNNLVIIGCSYPGNQRYNNFALIDITRACHTIQVRGMCGFRLHPHGLPL